MSFNYTNDTGNTVNISNIFQDGTDTTMTGYKVNAGNDLTFLPPFTTGTDASGSNSTYAASIPGYKYNGTQFQFCPKYQLHEGTAYYTSQVTFDSFTATTINRADTSISAQTIPAGVKKMLAVCIGGGGGGGGTEASGDSGGQADAGGGAGGGGGAMFSQLFNIASGVTTYTCSIGSGGIYGQPNNRSTTTGGIVKPGIESTSGDLKNGRDGTAGGNTTFTYNGTTITANGGAGGVGGRSNSDSPGNAVGGAGGTVTGSEPLVKAGTKGADVNSGTPLDNGITNPGGIGGKCGNLNTSDADGFFVNTSYVSFDSTQWTNTGSNATNITSLAANSNEVTPFYLKYGEGGHGGMGDDNGSHYGFAGEVGAPGCVIVFYYYT
jgi:hypothetical protein